MLVSRSSIDKGRFFVPLAFAAFRGGDFVLNCMAAEQAGILERFDVRQVAQRLHAEGGDLAPKFYPVLSSLQRFCVAVLEAVAAGCGAEPFRLRSTASRRGLIV